MCKLQIDVDAIEQLATNKELADKLADPNLDESEKQEMLNAVAVTVMKELGYTPNETKVVSTDEAGRDGESVKGHYNEGTNTNYINDKNNNSTNDLVATTGHEITHAMDKQEGTFKAGDADQNTYANNFGSDLSFYTGAALDYTHSTSMADTNNHTQSKSLEAYLQLQQNNQEFKNVDKQEGDNLTYQEAQQAQREANEFGVSLTITKDKTSMGGYVAVPPEVAAELASSGTPMTQQEKDKMAQDIKDGVVTGVENVNKASYPLAVGNAVVGNEFGAAFFGTVGVFTDGALLVLDKKSTESVVRDSIVDTIKPPGWKGEVAGTILKETVNYLEKKDSKKEEKK
ncbi:hypothetical protein FJR48_07295 [Sulfurimonas lithotrophica]|uniref:Uncharacterized protein n=2 Tax=Sulfurimonas lithotrophica TaxID=2590022 RepID=A0A5P8P1S9_9BACT|nr:hypothetical protein FJR48_07295 [Sulfurimonas lithotrophica]